MNILDNYDLMEEIRHIKAIDHHAHALPAGYLDADINKYPDPIGKTPFPYPVRLRLDNAEHIDAWRVLYGYRYKDMGVEHAWEALKDKLKIMAELGEQYPTWILDQVGIETMFVNMPSLGPGQCIPRFRWVVYCDGLLSPFVDAYAMGEKVIESEASPTLDTYLNDVVHSRLHKWQTEGAVAIKFGIAYKRSLDIQVVTVSKARAIYKHHFDADISSKEDDKYLEDFLFREICRHAGNIGLPVHIHTGIGADPYFNISGSNPLLLESLFNDVTLRDTQFVMLHGGWPFEREAGVMLIKPNVYADFSSQTFLRSAQALSEVLQAWLAWYPEKVLFGTDAYPDNTPLFNWEEKVWLATKSSREALVIALTRMMKAGQITHAGAVELATMVMRGNAERLYAF